MLKKSILPAIFISLSYGFWISPNFKEIASGISIFLFGMLILGEGFRAFSGGLLEKILKNTTNTLSKSIGFGFFVTVIMQSSALVSILTISFLGAGLLTLFQGIGIMLGANIGTTSGTWLMGAFALKVNISAFAMPILVFAILLIMQKSKVLQGSGYVLMGIGLSFLGIHYMKEGFEAFKDTIDVSQYAFLGKNGFFICMGIGLVATCVMQSSHATMILNITALSAGQISFENAVALNIGAAVGTTITAILGSLHSNTEGKRLAGAHFIFNILNALLAVCAMPYVMDAVNSISHFIGIAKENYALRLAVFDTFYKVVGVALLLPFMNYLVTFLQTFIKDKKSVEDTNLESIQYLNESVLELPTTSFVAILNETKHLYEIAFKIISNGLILKRRNIISEMDLESVIHDEYTKEEVDVNREYLTRVQEISGTILDFATRAQLTMDSDNVAKMYELKLANRAIVLAIKATQHLCKNMRVFTKSDNQYIKNEYNRIRKNLIQLLRIIHTISNCKNEGEMLSLLSLAKIYAEKNDIFANGTLDNLIRERLIPNEVATAMMNDSAYAYEISQNLITMTEALFVNQNNELDTLNKVMNLNDEEIDEYVKENRSCMI